VEDPLDEYNPANSTDAARINRQLAKNERKSAATETLFTVAILFFSYIQLKGFTIFQKPDGVVIGQLNTLPVDIVFWTVLILAGMIGWKSVYTEIVLSYQDLKEWLTEDES
jgi:hypothetical protein